MLRATLLTCLLAACSAQMVLDCHSRGSIARINFMRFNPHPIRIPGKLRLSLDAEVTQELKDFDVQVNVERRALDSLVWMPVPCYFGIIGSCLYTDFCASMGYFFHDGCPAHWKDYGIEQCKCPLSPGRFTMRDVEIDLQKPSSSELWKNIPGHYRATIEIFERTTKRLLLACSAIEYTLVHG